MEHLELADGLIAYDLVGAGPLVVLAHGMGDSRRSFRFVAPRLVAAGYRVANVDIRGCGESTTGWPRYERTDIAADLIALISHLGGPAVIVGQSISGGAATIAAATAPELVSGVVELAPFTRAQSPDIRGLVRSSRHRRAAVHLARVMMTGSIEGWMSYLDLAVQQKPTDWNLERERIERALRDPERMAVLKAMTKTSPADAGARLADLRVPALIVMGADDPDWADPRAEGDGIIQAIPDGLGHLELIGGAGHYPHSERPDELVAIMLPFIQRVAADRAEADHA